MLVFKDCKIVPLPQKTNPSYLAFALQKDSPFLEIFNYFLLKMMEVGEIKRITEKYTTFSQECPNYSGKPLGFNSCVTAFGLLCFGLAIAWILYLGELIATGIKWISSGQRKKKEPNKCDVKTDQQAKLTNKLPPF